MAYGKNNATEKQREAVPPTLIAWSVTERGEKKFWNRIGAAWENKDCEGFSLQLDMIPLNGGRIVLRTPRKEDEGAE